MLDLLCNLSKTIVKTALIVPAVALDILYIGPAYKIATDSDDDSPFLTENAVKGAAKSAKKSLKSLEDFYDE